MNSETKQAMRKVLDSKGQNVQAAMSLALHLLEDSGERCAQSWLVGQGKGVWHQCRKDRTHTGRCQ